MAAQAKCGVNITPESCQIKHSGFLWLRNQSLTCKQSNRKVSSTLSAVFLVRPNLCPTVLQIHFERVRTTVHSLDILGAFVAGQQLR